MFYDRNEAGEKLAVALAKFKNRPDTIVVALPRGGVVPGYIVARELNLPLDVILIKKLGHPFNPEYAIGAVSLKEYVLDRYGNLPGDYIDKEVQKIRSLLNKRYELYYGDRKPESLAGKTVLVVDDGIATGHSIFSAIRLIQSEGAEKVVVAVPVAPPDVLQKLIRRADEVICLEAYQPFKAVGLYYQNFEQVSDNEVKKLLQRAASFNAGQRRRSV